MPRYTSKAYLGLPGQVKRYRPNTVSADDLLAIYLEQLVSEMDEKEFLTKRFFFFLFILTVLVRRLEIPVNPFLIFFFLFWNEFNIFVKRMKWRLDNVKRVTKKWNVTLGPGSTFITRLCYGNQSISLSAHCRWKLGRTSFLNLPFDTSFWMQKSN